MKVVNLVVILLLQNSLSVITGQEVSLDEVATSTIDDDDLLRSFDKATKIIQSEDGDLIDFFNIYKQPSFNHPSVKEHKIQMKSNYDPTIDTASRRMKKNAAAAFPEQSQGAPVSHISKTIQSEYGDVIDCIPIDKQPAFSHPALKNHTIQMRPSTVDQTTAREGSIPISLTMWQRNGRCPQGTIPIRRSNTEKAHHQDKKTTMEEDGKNLLQFNHSLAVLIAQGFAYYGAKGDIKVCYPQVEHDDDYTASQVTLVTGPYRNFEAIKSGWTVNPGVYGDRQTRIFVYWTVDGSVSTGCFDHTCPGFVQTNTDILLGSPISPISSSSNSRDLPLTPIITIFIQKDPVTSNWWVHYNEEVSVGYWPAELFSGLRFHAKSVQWGGEVYSSRVGVHPGHTATHMACGRFANPWPHSGSGSVKRMRVQQNAELVSPVFVDTYVDEYRCYNTMYLKEYVWDPELLYGGPGRNPTCP